MLFISSDWIPAFGFSEDSDFITDHHSPDYEFVWHQNDLNSVIFWCVVLSGEGEIKYSDNSPWSSVP